MQPFGTRLGCLGLLDAARSGFQIFLAEYCYGGQILARAAKQFDELSAGAPAVVKDFVRRVVQRVVVHPDRIEVEVGKQKLRDTLTTDPHAPSARPATDQLEQGSSDVIRLDIETRVKRCGGEMRLLFPPDHPGQAPSLSAPSLLKALARGR